MPVISTSHLEDDGICMSTSIVSYLYYLMRSLNGSAILLPENLPELLRSEVSASSNDFEVIREHTSKLLVS
jgi:hypothetical protein